MLVLASASPRRRQLLAWLVREYAVDAAEIDESASPDETPTTLVRRLARTKAGIVAARRPSDWILAADTIVEIDGDVLGKPADGTQAVTMLQRLAGREHRVATGFALVAPGGTVHAEDVVLSRVHFRPMDARALADYVASGESEGKAGAYAVQGFGAGLIDRVDGSLTNVIGLPLAEVGRALAEAGLVER